MLYQKIKTGQLEARKLRKEIDTKVLTMLLSEADSIQLQKLPEDKQESAMMDIILRYGKNLLKNIASFSGNKVFFQELNDELEVIKKYLPIKLSKEDIIEIFSRNNYKSFGELMKYLSSYHKGQYDAKLVREVWEEFHGK
jgi:uncharacterized protein YqeY